MAFIRFMLCDRLTDAARLVDRRCIAEPKLDGQRAQLHIPRRSDRASVHRRQAVVNRQLGDATGLRKEDAGRGHKEPAGVRPRGVRDAARI
jgi:ATP-dependent DNA ligase